MFHPTLLTTLSDLCSFFLTCFHFFQKTEVIKKTLNPVWNFEYTVNQLKGRDELKQYGPLVFNLYDWNKIMKHQFLGRATFDLQSLKDGVEWKGSLKLEEDPEVKVSPRGKKKPISGTLEVVLLYSDPSLPSELVQRYKSLCSLSEVCSSPPLIFCFS